MLFTERNRKLVATIKHLEDLEKKQKDLHANYNSLIKSIEDRERRIKEKDTFLTEEFTRKEKNLNSQAEALKKIFEEKSKGFPWLSEAISEYYRYIDFEIADYLEKKSHPAQRAAEELRSVASEKSLLRKQFKLAQNFVNYYETLFPWLVEYVGEDLDELLNLLTKEDEEEQDFDPVLKFMPKAEYELLSEEVRNQKALDRYLCSAKKPWQIGRDYERYIGYLYENKGYKVDYQGIEKGLEDLGRDLICTIGDGVEIVQCKCWASHKTIHEKHINQLYGTAVKYYIEHKQIIDKKKELTLFPDLIKSQEIRATFITSTVLSETAMKFADALGIKVIQKKPLEKYPIIKCNVALNGERIYHLPFDQQYDNTMIFKRGEFYVTTVKEAMDKDFRRAYRWKGTREQ